MGTVIIVLVVVVLVCLVGFAVALAAKGRRTAAAALGSNLAPNVPKEWAGAHSPEAKLHRRLVAAATTLSTVPLGDAAQIERRVAVDLELRDLDEQLVAAARTPEPQRTRTLATLEPRIRAAESATTQLTPPP